MGSINAAATLTLGLVARRNPLRGGVIAADLGLVNGTPHVLIDGAGGRRRAAYLAPHAIQIGGAIFWQRAGQGLDSPLVVALTNYQVPPQTFGGGLSTGSMLGAGIGAGGTTTPSADWAATMTDTANEDGALLPLILGEVSR